MSSFSHHLGYVTQHVAASCFQGIGAKKIGLLTLQSAKSLVAGGKGGVFIGPSSLKHGFWMIAQPSAGPGLASLWGGPPIHPALDLQPMAQAHPHPPDFLGLPLCSNALWWSLFIPCACACVCRSLLLPPSWALPSLRHSSLACSNATKRSSPYTWAGCWAAV